MYAINSNNYCGRMAELVDALVLGTSFERSEGSSPFSPTKEKVKADADKNDYVSVNDMLLLSTKQKRWSVENVVNSNCGGLRNQY